MKKIISVMLIILFLFSVFSVPAMADDNPVYMPLVIHVQGVTIRFWQYVDVNENGQYDGIGEDSSFVGHAPPYLYRLYHFKCLANCGNLLIPEFFGTGGSYGRKDVYLAWGTWQIKTNFYGITHPCHTGEIVIVLQPEQRTNPEIEVYIPMYRTDADPCPIN